MWQNHCPGKTSLSWRNLVLLSLRDWSSASTHTAMRAGGYMSKVRSLSLSFPQPSHTGLCRTEPQLSNQLNFKKYSLDNHFSAWHCQLLIIKILWWSPAEGTGTEPDQIPYFNYIAWARQFCSWRFSIQHLQGCDCHSSECKQLTYYLKLNIWKIYFIEVSCCKEKMVIDFTNIPANSSSHFSNAYDAGKKIGAFLVVTGKKE